MKIDAHIALTFWVLYGTYIIDCFQGYYNSPECRYVTPNSGQVRYSFTVQLNSCGTQFVDQFSEGKQAYLENVLVLQNEPGIQEVGDAPPALHPVSN